MKTKFIATISTLVLLTNIAHAFEDVSAQNKHIAAINSLTEKNIINGYNDGTFKPDEKINRAEFLKIIISTKTATPSGENCFTDVKTEWFAKYICYAKDSKIIDGYLDNTFRPASDINLAEATKIILGGNLPTNPREYWYAPYARIADEKNYFDNIDPRPEHLITRGEAAQLIFNVIETANSEPNLEPSTKNYIYSWDKLLTYKDFSFPIVGLFDNEYETLPPGTWDWNDSNNDGANYRNFETNIGTFEALKDIDGNQYGWKLIGNNPDAIDYSGAAAYFEGSPGIEIINLGKNGEIGSFGSGNLGDGPDVLVFDKSHTLDFRTGSSISGSKHDNDLVIAGCNPNTGTSFDISTTTIHTGPGSDLVFVRDMERSAIDAGNGNSGDTSVIDEADKADTVIFRGNMLDFRFFGGNGNDTAVWYVDEVNQEPSTWLGPNFFGGGGSGDAIWGDTGTDTLVLAIPADTKITDTTPTKPGELLVRIPKDYSNEIVWDNPVYDDIYARYCISCGISKDNKKTLTLEYNKKDGTVSTGYFTVTDFENLQIGTGTDAKTYEFDNINGKVILNQNLQKYSTESVPSGYCYT